MLSMTDVGEKNICDGNVLQTIGRLCRDVYPKTSNPCSGSVTDTRSAGGVIGFVFPACTHNTMAPVMQWRHVFGGN